MSNHDEFFEKLRAEWFSSRAYQIHQELNADWARYTRELRPGHASFAPAGFERSARPPGHRDDEPADVTAISAANTEAAAEGVIVAMAMYLARQETNTPTSDGN